MPSFFIDHATGRATLEIRKGAQIARSAELNGNTAYYDGNGVLCRYELASPGNASGIDLTDIPEHDACFGLLEFYSDLNPTN